MQRILQSDQHIGSAQPISAPMCPSGTEVRWGEQQVLAVQDWKLLHAAPQGACCLCHLLPSPHPADKTEDGFNCGLAEWPSGHPLAWPHMGIHPRHTCRRHPLPRHLFTALVKRQEGLEKMAGQVPHNSTHNINPSTKIYVGKELKQHKYTAVYVE